MTILADRVGQKSCSKIYRSSVVDISPPRHWKQLPNLFIGPLLISACSKKGNRQTYCLISLSARSVSLDSTFKSICLKIFQATEFMCLYSFLQVSDLKKEYNHAGNVFDWPGRDSGIRLDQILHQVRKYHRKCRHYINCQPSN